MLAELHLPSTSRSERSDGTTLVPSGWCPAATQGTDRDPYRLDDSGIFVPPVPVEHREAEYDWSCCRC